jgi:hypothetical protein
MLNFWGETHYLLLEGNEEMNEWFEGPQNMGLMNSQEEEEEEEEEGLLLLFNFLPWNKEDICSHMSVFSWGRGTRGCSQTSGDILHAYLLQVPTYPFTLPKY